MREFLKGIPIPMAGVSLGFTALGNLLNAYSPILRWICGFIALILILLVLSKIFLCPRVVREEIKNPIIASVSATIFMSLMQLATYGADLPHMYQISFVIWAIAFCCHILLIIYFTLRLIYELKLHHIYPTCFVTYVGIIVSAITSPTFGLEKLGQIIFWIGFMVYIVLFIVITIRYMRHEIEEGARPLFAIYAAPMSLSLTGYLTVMNHPSITLIIVLEILAQVIYFVVLYQLPNLLKLPFYPSFAAFTFPMVITPFALQTELQYFTNNFDVQISGIIALVLILETSIAIGLVLYTLKHYIHYLKTHYHTNCKNINNDMADL